VKFFFSKLKAETPLHGTELLQSASLHSDALHGKYFATFILPELYSAMARATATSDHILLVLEVIIDFSIGNNHAANPSEEINFLEKQRRMAGKKD
jgi:hypothetical protein